MLSQSVRVMFWNAMRADLSLAVGSIAAEHDVDVVVLAENGASPTALLLALNTGDSPAFFVAPCRCDRITLLTRLPGACVVPRFDADRFTAVELRLPLSKRVLIVAAHLQSRMWKRPADDYTKLQRLATRIREIEAECGHTRTVVVGDLNADPFDDGMMGFSAMHAVASRKVAARESRRNDEHTSPFFYNPMWSFLGDGRSASAGTHYHDKGGEVVPFWHCFDQVLYRPGIAGHLGSDDVRVLTRTRDVSLVDGDGRPDAERFSDHLPLVFRIPLTQQEPADD